MARVPCLSSLMRPGSTTPADGPAPGPALQPPAHTHIYPKPGRPSALTTSYRPTSLLSTIPKALERLVLKGITLDIIAWSPLKTWSSSQTLHLNQQLLPPQTPITHYTNRHRHKQSIRHSTSPRTYKQSTENLRHLRQHHHHLQPSQRSPPGRRSISYSLQPIST